MVSECDMCQRVKCENVQPPGLLQPLPIPKSPWQDIAMDFIEGLPSSGIKNASLVVVDRLMKYGHFLALRHPYSTQDVATLFMKEIYRLHGLPSTTVSDRDSIFTSHFWQDMVKSMGTKLTMSTSYHPQTDGQTERLNRCLESYLRAMVFTNPKQWLQWLPLAEWWYNTNHRNSLNTTPFQALYGYAPPQVPMGSLPYSIRTPVGLCLAERQQLLQQLKDNLIQAHSRMKFFADRRRSDRTLQTGDMVYLKLQPYRQNSVALTGNLKRSARYYGPYKVLEKIGAIAYRLDLPSDYRSIQSFIYRHSKNEWVQTWCLNSSLLLVTQTVISWCSRWTSSNGNSSS